MSNTTTLFMGVSITLTSFERKGFPGAWWPHASLTAASGAALEGVALPEHRRSKDEADVAALRFAMLRIREKRHQG